jgi:hypothetical protein
MHDVFRLFKNDLDAFPPHSQDLEWAFDASVKLSLAMPEPYPDETARGAVFKNCLGPVFRDIHYAKITSTDGRVGYPDGVVDYQGVNMIFIEVKNESGAGADPFMQLARDYQMYTSSLPGDSVLDGHPMILIAVAGL